MAKGKSSRGGRDASVIARATTLDDLIQPNTFPLPATPSVIVSHYKIPTDNTLTDRRTYFPDRRVRPVAAVTRQASRIVARDSLGDRIRRQTKAPLAFARPHLVAVCAKRKVRKEVLHALGLKNKRRGKGGGKRRRNFWSSISCK